MPSAEAPRNPANTNRPRRIGIWCDYGFTLSPFQGIGVFVRNLALGLVEASSEVEVVILYHPGDPSAYAQLRAESKGRIHLHPPLPSSLWVRGWLWATQLCRNLCRQVASQGRGWKKRLVRLLLAQLAACWTALRQKEGLAAFSGIVLLGFALLLAGIVVWAGYAVLGLLAYAIRVVLFPLQLLDRFLRRLHAPGETALETAASAGCDVWIVPWLNLPSCLPRPAVLVIHDLVHEHFPETFADPEETARLRIRAKRRCEEAVLCVCMARTICDRDLLGILQLPREKVRVVPFASPADLPRLTPDQARKRIPKRLRRPFVLYPAGFRTYKNHRLLLEALHLLQRDHGVEDLELVFTGFEELPAELSQYAEALGVRDRLYVLREVSREELAALYCLALATVVPSLYEQGSFPALEALELGCPVACSDIPAFREQFAEIESAIIWFDPQDPAAVARALWQIRLDRSAVQASQQQAYRAFRQRSWADVAKAWLAILDEAISLSDQAQPPPRYLPSRWFPPTRRLPLQLPQVFVWLCQPLSQVRWRRVVEVLDILKDRLEQRGWHLAVAAAPEQEDASLQSCTRIEYTQVYRLPAQDAVGFLQVDQDRFPDVKHFAFPGDAAVSALMSRIWVVFDPPSVLPVLPIRPCVLCVPEEQSKERVAWVGDSNPNGKPLAWIADPIAEHRRAWAYRVLPADACGTLQPPGTAGRAAQVVSTSEELADAIYAAILDVEAEGAAQRTSAVGSRSDQRIERVGVCMSSATSRPSPADESDASGR
jgi:glycosyltransferase involved in cell wall biosynthesis